MPEANGAMQRVMQNMSRPQVPPRDARIEPIDPPPQAAPEPTGAEQSEEQFQVKQTTMRIDQEVLQRIDRLCSQSSITRDTLLEAAYLLAEDNERFKVRLLRIAQERKELRDRIGMKRRLHTLSKNYG